MSVFPEETDATVRGQGNPNFFLQKSPVVLQKEKKKANPNEIVRNSVHTRYSRVVQVVPTAKINLAAAINKCRIDNKSSRKIRSAG